jgi:hypothetical protein
MIKKIRKDVSGNPDASLIKGLKEGDRIAYTRLLSKYYDMVFLILSALDETGDEEQVREKTSGVLFSIWTNRDSIEACNPLKNHLFDFIHKQFKENGGKI